ncbi:MAG: NAD(P)-dependent alcohol dehydrogenase [Myxococcota bacterium]|nr:NAD(P)-dependent alcohol dehydrogenase [Myxococcota bacterium]
MIEALPESRTVWALEERFGLQQLRQRIRPLPALGPGQVLIKLHAASLNYRDLLMVQGKYNPKQPLPLVPCSDGAGEVIATGAGCQMKVGARVSSLFAQGWLDGPPSRAHTRQTLGGPLDGCLATHIILPEEGVALIPDSLSFEEAATLPCAALTAYSALFVEGNFQPGQRLLTIGTGGVSLFAAQLAAAAGGEVFLCSRSPEKLEKVAHLAHHCIDSKTHPEWGREIRRLSGGGVDQVIEVGGAGTLSRSLEAVRAGGTISLIGILDGAAAPINLLPILMRQVRVQGILVGHRRGYQALVRLLSHQPIKPTIAESFSFHEVPAAFKALSRGPLGKIVLNCDLENGASSLG